MKKGKSEWKDGDEVRIKFSGEFIMGESGLTMKQALKDVRSEWDAVKSKLERTLGNGFIRIAEESSPEVVK